MPQTSSPVSATLRAYQVGLGDCFLLSFHYSATSRESDRHVLVDFGSMGLPNGRRERDQLLRIARDIKLVCQDKLAVVVASHRHKGHISGFATNKRRIGPGDLIASCSPRRVIQPWTEHPKRKSIVRKPTDRLSPNERFVASLEVLHLVSEATLRETKGLGAALRKSLRDELLLLADSNLNDCSARENLMRLGEGGRARYVNYGADADVEGVLPGVRVHVLGPPDLEQSGAIRRRQLQGRDDFWQLQARTGSLVQSSTSTSEIFPGAEVFSGSRIPLHCRWLIRRMGNLRGGQLLALMKILDGQVNNTSVILLFESGSKRLLFPGDAHAENWLFALSKKRTKELLKTVNLYKVGDHGSSNGTPKKSLWERFDNRSLEPSPRRLQTVVSTMAGKYGSPDKGTEVPRRTLVATLERETQFITTQSLAGDDLVHITEIDLK